MKTKTLSIALLAIVVLSGCSPLLRGRADRQVFLQRSAEKYLHSVYLKGSSWSIMAVDLRTGRILLSRDADRSLIPASGMKLLTTACALETLKPDYRIATHVGYTGEIDSSGVLRGDLVVIGAGDPTISTRWGSTRPAGGEANFPDAFEAWADSIARRGIHSIDGDLVGYTGLFGTDVLGSGWEWNDLKYWYAAEITPLTYTDGCIEITVTPGDSANATAGIAWAPDAGVASIYGGVVTSEPDGEPEIHLDRKLESNIITIWGSIPLNYEPQKRWVAVHDADAFFMKALQEAFILEGISTNGKAITAHSNWPDTADFNLVFKNLSPPLNRIIQVINRDSQNLYAESLIRVLGLEMIQQGELAALYEDDAFRAGRNQVRMWEAGLAGASTGFAMVDGSGLSRRNLISASGLIKVLVHMNRSPYRSDFIHSLATPGQVTLKMRFQGLPVGIYLHAKTGTMGRVRSLSGYLGTEDGVKIAFSFVCNNYLCESEEIEQTMENLCQLLALYLKEGHS